MPALIDKLPPPAPRERRIIVYTNEGDQWSVLDRGCGIAVIEAGNKTGQEAFEDHDGERMVEAADEAGTCYVFDDPGALLTFLEGKVDGGPDVPKTKLVG
jgi:hypothetical protein